MSTFQILIGGFVGGVTIGLLIGAEWVNRVWQQRVCRIHKDRDECGS